MEHYKLKTVTWSHAWPSKGISANWPYKEIKYWSLQGKLWWVLFNIAVTGPSGTRRRWKIEVESRPWCWVKENICALKPYIFYSFFMAQLKTMFWLGRIGCWNLPILFIPSLDVVCLTFPKSSRKNNDWYPY
jgi:hypothetical protein